MIVLKKKKKKSLQHFPCNTLEHRLTKTVSQHFYFIDEGRVPQHSVGPDITVHTIFSILENLLNVSRQSELLTLCQKRIH